MRCSALYEAVGRKDKADQIRGTAEDVDLAKYLTRKTREEIRERSTKFGMLRDGDEGKWASRAYAKSDIAIPFMPNLMVDYQDGATYVADLVSPIIPGNVARRFAKGSRRDGSRLLDLRMDSKGQPKEANIDIFNDTYLEQPYGEQQRIANQDIADAANLPALFNMHRRAVMYDLKRARENRVLTQLMTASNYASGCTSALAGNNRWDVGPSTSTANPVTDIRVTAGTAPGLARAFNTMLIGKLAFEYLRTHPKVIAVAGVRALDRVVSQQELEEMFSLKIVVADVKYDTAGNTSTANYAFLAPKSCALIFVQPGASVEELSFAKTIRHVDINFEEIPDRVSGVSGVTILKGTHSDAEKVIASDCGYLLDTVIS